MPAAFFHACLGPRLKYSSCLYKNPGDGIAEAEEHALKETAEHADLQDGQRILVGRQLLDGNGHGGKDFSAMLQLLRGRLSALG